jgi:hypothetical protein
MEIVMQVFNPRHKYQDLNEIHIGRKKIKKVEREVKKQLQITL